MSFRAIILFPIRVVSIIVYLPVKVYRFGYQCCSYPPQSPPQKRKQMQALTHKNQTHKNQTDVISGIYIVQYDSQTIKIGRSKNVESRLKSYRGYMPNGSDVKRLLIIHTTDYVQLEHQIHQFAVDQGLERLGQFKHKTEVFKVKNQSQFIHNLKRQLPRITNAQLFMRTQ